MCVGVVSEGLLYGERLAIVLVYGVGDACLELYRGVLWDCVCAIAACCLSVLLISL